MVVTAQFDRISFLKVGQSVDLKGRIMGEITAIYRSGEYIYVDLDIEPETRMPKNTIAVLYQPSFLGGRGITLYTADSVIVAPFLSHGDTIMGEVKTHKENVSEKLDPYLPIFDKITAFSIGDSMALDYYLKVTNESLRSIRKQTVGVNRSIRSKNIDDLLSQTRKQLSTLRDLLAEPSKQGGLPDIEFIQKMHDNNSISGFSSSIDSTLIIAQQYVTKVDTGLVSFDQQLLSIAERIEKIVSNEDSTWSTLLYDRATRDSLKNNVRSTSFLLKDIRLNPKKYISLR